jgi:pimeloyl-ACP methyl ester carboxylesterase
VLAVTVVFVNGNPETAAVWSPLLTELGRADVLTLAPPGFGGPVPAGFGATADEYLRWLVAELEAVDQPVDLVGHDWGANHVLRLAGQRPDLLRSWCTDTAGVFAPDYVWDDATRAWRTPGDGENAVAYLLDMGTAARTSMYESLGMTSPIAEELAKAFDAAMGECILKLYRSADQSVLAHWSAQVQAASARPGLVLIPSEDPYTGGEARHRWVAEQTGAQVVVLEGLGHWWMLQNPKAGTDALRDLWAAL